MFKVLRVTTAGTAGNATGSASTTIHGEIVGIKFDYHASAPATTDVVVSTHAIANLVTLSNTATDVYKIPALQMCDSAGAGIAGAYSKVQCDGSFNIAVAGCDALTNALVATVYYR